MALYVYHARQMCHVSSIKSLVFKQNLYRTFSTVLPSQKDKRKILFFGTDKFSLPTLEALHRNTLDPSQSVISRLEVCCSDLNHLVQAVKAYAQESGLPIHSWPPNISDGEFDLGIIASFGHLIPSRIINKFPLGMLNVHASLLPRWRGASPIPHAIMHGDSETGVSIMEIWPKHFDMGNVLATDRCQIGQDERRPDLEKRLSVLGANLMLKVLIDLEGFQLKSHEQDEALVTLAPKLTKKSFEILWEEKTSREVYNQWRALADLGKLYSHWKDSNVIVHFSEIVPPEVVESFKLDSGDDYAAGQVVAVKRNKERFVCIKCKSGWSAFRHFYYGPKKVMTSSDFFNGFISRNCHRKLFFGKNNEVPLLK